VANGDAEKTIRLSASGLRLASLQACKLRKCLKTLKTAKASYWLELAWIWDRRQVRFGSAPRSLAAALVSSI
jgi:hypothetical protein